METIIFINSDRMNKLYPSGDTVTATQLITKINQMAAHTQVNGVVVDLKDYDGFAAAYDVWDADPTNPLAANFVAQHLKSLIYSLAPAYPNVQYMVLVGEDRVIPHRRLRDEALIANEYNYAANAYTDQLSGSFSYFYFLSDDYYAGLLPFPYGNREFYLPQVAIGRLVETPSEMAGVITEFMTNPVQQPDDAMITGYDFLIDQATEISDTLATAGITNLITLINDSWTAAVFSSTLFALAEGPDIISFNSHFDHFRMFPNDANDIFATQITATTDYAGALVYSVGCHAGLNMPDSEALNSTHGRDWSQAFLSQQATFIGSTGYAYGDSDLVAYSELLMANFTEALSDWSEGPQTVGLALMMAKHDYFNSLAGGTFSNYDEKVLEEMTLYGLPMLRINMPLTTTNAPASALGMTAMASNGLVTQTAVSLSFSYTLQTVAGVGSYYELNQPEADVYVSAGRPSQPRLDIEIDQPGPVGARRAARRRHFYRCGAVQPHRVPIDYRRAIHCQRAPL